MKNLEGIIRLFKFAHIKIISLIILTFMSMEVYSPKIFEGKASYYHDKFEGRITASGEIFNQNKITAASNKIPLNSKVKVWVKGKEDTLLIRVNDRMSKKYGEIRDLDLSKQAMKELAGKQGIRDGVITVQYKIL